MNSSNEIGTKQFELSITESNSLKGIALILLLIHHLFYIQNGQYDDIYIEGHGHGLVNLLGIICKVCVAIFVFLSGYGLGTGIVSNRKLNIKEFYLRRFTKLFLNYWFIWLLFVPIGILCFDRSFDGVYGKGTDGWLSGILDFLGLLNLTGKHGYNPTWWFYSCIILLYLIFPLIAYSISKYPKSIWLWLLVGIAIIKVPIAFIEPIRYYLFPFVLGILLSNALILNTLPPPTATCSTASITAVLSSQECTIASPTQKYEQTSDNQKNAHLTFTSYSRNYLNSILSGSLGIAGIIVMVMLLVTACIIRLTTPYALLWDTCVAILIILLYKSAQRLINFHGALEFLGKHSFNIFLFHTFIYYLYFPIAIYWSRNPIIIFFSLLLSSIAISIGLEKLKEFIGFYKLQKFIMEKNLKI